MCGSKFLVRCSTHFFEFFKVAAEKFSNPVKSNEIGQNLIVLVILNHSRQSILLKNAFLSDRKDSKNFQYWFPFLNFNSKETTGQLIERTINEFEEEFCKNLINIETESKACPSSKKCESICLIRIYSTHLLPLYLHHKSNSPKLTFFLVILNQLSKLNHLNRQNPNEINNDNLDEKLMWMNLNELEQAQRSYKLLGLEPLLFFKKFIIESNELNLMVDNVFYEPKMTYFQCENQLNNKQPASLVDLMVLSAKFHKNVQERLFNIYYEFTYPSEYLSVVRFKILFNKFANFLLQQIDANTNLDNALERYFFAFDVNQKCLLTFSDFLMGENFFFFYFGYFDSFSILILNQDRKKRPKKELFTEILKQL
ncbi:hypothetical protein BpHYR1_020015 [Brachionus plicatilis]|uniref:Uncharacterized protein n=1 Tax=Brachionus plicatilis TaxID=10195 RepID=A0A3M7PUQ5_BRAPC|nr:hypothetical protein BpHYR1_020015 [Brachionus plicatilis]